MSIQSFAIHRARADSHLPPRTWTAAQVTVPSPAKGHLRSPVPEREATTCTTHVLSTLKHIADRRAGHQGDAWLRETVLT